MRRTRKTIRRGCSAGYATPRGRYDTPVIILVEGAFDTYFFLRLRQLAQPQPGDPFVVIFHIIGILQFAFYSVTPGYFF